MPTVNLPGMNAKQESSKWGKKDMKQKRRKNAQKCKNINRTKKKREVQNRPIECAKRGKMSKISSGVVENKRTACHSDLS